MIFRIINFRAMLVSFALLVLIGILSLILVSLVAAAGDTTQAVFAAYQNVLPGRSLSDLELPDQMDCLPGPSEPVQYQNRTYCGLFLDDGPIDLVVVEAEHDLITGVRYYSESLQLGELIAQWQEPEQRLRGGAGRTMKFTWEKGDYTITAVAILLGTQPYVRTVNLNLT